MFLMVDMDFVDWVKSEMEKRQMNQSHMADIGGITRASINKFLQRQQRSAGPELCRAIARAFKLPEVEIFVKAGLIQKPSDKTDLLSEQLYNLSKTELDEDEKQLMIDFAHTLIQRQRRGNATKITYPGAAATHAAAEPKEP